MRKHSREVPVGTRHPVLERKCVRVTGVSHRTPEDESLFFFTGF